MVCHKNRGILSSQQRSRDRSATMFGLRPYQKMVQPNFIENKMGSAILACWGHDCMARVCVKEISVLVQRRQGRATVLQIHTCNQFYTKTKKRVEFFYSVRINPQNIFINSKCICHIKDFLRRFQSRKTLAVPISFIFLLSQTRHCI